MALAANALLTTEELRSYLAADMARDPELEAAINEASDLADSICGTRLRQATYTDEAHDGTDSVLLWLNNAPVLSIASLTEDAITIASDCYKLYPREGKVRRRDGAFGTGAQAVLCTYTAGYSYYDAGDYAAWVSGTAYALGALVTGKAAGLYTLRVYQALAAHTAASGDEPGVGASWVTKWAMVGDCALNGAVPNGLKRAVKELCGWLLRSEEHTGVKSEGEDGMSISYEGVAVPVTIGQKFAPYRLIRLGV
jgi:hypothetical protein